MRHQHLGVGALLVGMLIAISAMADVNSPTAQAKAAARAIADEGWNHYAAGRYEDARRAFSEAEAKVHAPTFLLMMARAHDKLGQLIEARDVYKRILEEKLTADASPAFVQAQENAQRELATLAPRIPTVTIVVTGTASNVTELTLDGVSVEPSSLVERNPGYYVLVAAMAGRRSVTRTIHLTEGAREQIAIDTVSLTVKPVSMGSTRVVTRDPPNSEDKGNAKNVADLPLAQRHTILPTQIKPPNSARIALLVGGGIAAGAGVATGVVLTVLANGRASDAEGLRNDLLARWNNERRCPSGDPTRCAELKDAAYDETDLRSGAHWSFVAGGAIGVGTLVYGLVTMESTKSAPRAQVTPLFGPGAAGVSFSGRF